MKRRPRRTLLLSGLLLLAGGAIVNVAVAWVIPNLFGERMAFTTTYGDGTQVVSSHLVDEHRGWPLGALTSWTDPVDGLSYSYTIELGSFELPWWPPLWPGFAINTVFYAAILWALFAVPFALRRRRRIKRGLCPKCAYDMRGRGLDSATCPECGTTQ